MLDFMIYKSNIPPTLIQPPGPNSLQTERIPLKMMDPYLERGCNLTIDNWYATSRLAAYLLQRSNKDPTKPIFPKDFPQDKYIHKRIEVFKEHKHLLGIKYRGTKDIIVGKPKIVNVISTRHSAGMLNTAEWMHKTTLLPLGTIITSWEEFTEWIISCRKLRCEGKPTGGTKRFSWHCYHCWAVRSSTGEWEEN